MMELTEVVDRFIAVLVKVQPAQAITTCPVNAPHNYHMGNVETKMNTQSIHYKDYLYWRQKYISNAWSDFYFS